MVLERKALVVNGYTIVWNTFWKEFQVSHENIGKVIACFKSKEDAIEYCKKG